MLIPSWNCAECLEQGQENFFFQALVKRHISIVVLDLVTYIATTLESKFDHEVVGCKMPWDALVWRFVNRRIHSEDKARTVSALSIESLIAFCDSGLQHKSIEARCQQETTDAFEWVEVMVTVMDAEERQLLITTRSIGETRLHKRVMDQFLFHQNCDFFILVNTTENTYEVFDVSAGALPTPEMGKVDYIADMVRFNRQSVVASEAEKIIELMMPENMVAILENQDEYTFSCGLITASGEYRRAKLQLISFDRKKAQVIITRSDITSLYLDERQKSDQLFHAIHDAQRDLLTDLYNQSTTVQIVTQMLETYQGARAALLFIDVDNFKSVNDTLGHLQGDIILKKVANFLKILLKNEWIVGRIGGDEFLLFMPNITSAQEVEEVSRQICSAFDSFREMLKGIPVSCSVGVSLYPQDGLTYEQLVMKADQALYRAKRCGKNTFSMYSDDLAQPSYISALSAIE